MDYASLKIKLLEPAIVAIADDEAIVSSLEANNIDVIGTILKGDLKTYLRINGLWIPLKTSQSQTAILALEILNDPDTTDTTFDLSDSQSKAFLEAMLDQLIIDIAEMTIAHKNAIIAIGITKTSWAKQNAYVPLRIGYLNKARAL